MQPADKGSGSVLFHQNHARSVRLSEVMNRLRHAGVNVAIPAPWSLGRRLVVWTLLFLAFFVLGVALCLWGGRTGWLHFERAVVIQALTSSTIAVTLSYLGILIVHDLRTQPVSNKPLRRCICQFVGVA